MIPFLNFLVTEILLPSSLPTSFLSVVVTAAGEVFFIVPHTLLTPGTITQERTLFAFSFMLVLDLRASAPVGFFDA